MNGKVEMSNPKEQPRMRATSFADANASAKASSIGGGVRTFRESNLPCSFLCAVLCMEMPQNYLGEIHFASREVFIVLDTLLFRHAPI